MQGTLAGSILGPLTIEHSFQCRLASVPLHHPRRPALAPKLGGHGAGEFQFRSEFGQHRRIGGGFLAGSDWFADRLLSYLLRSKSVAHAEVESTALSALWPVAVSRHVFLPPASVPSFADDLISRQSMAALTHSPDTGRLGDWCSQANTHREFAWSHRCACATLC